MNPSLRRSGTRVRVHNLTASISVVSKTHIALDFDESGREPMMMTNEQAEQEFGNSLFLVSAKQPSTTKSLSLAQKFELERRRVYLSELHKIVGKNRVGGKIKRQQAIENARAILCKSGCGCEGEGECKVKLISAGTLGEWAKLENGHIDGCAKTLPRHTRNAKTNKYEGPVQDLALEVLCDKFLVPNPPSVQDLFNSFIDRGLKELQTTLKKLPCRETFRKWVQGICPELRAKTQFSKAQSKRLLRNAVKKYITSRPLERVEGDGLVLQIGVNDEDENYLGTLLFIIFIDCYTRMIVGYEMQVGKGEASSTVISALRHAICPKQKGTFNPDCKSDWPIYGCIEEIYVDGGPGFSSLETLGFAASFGAILTILESYAPWLKPFIERLNGTIRTKFAKKVASYVGTLNDQKKSDETAKKLAVLTVQQARDLFELWVVDEYHHTPHSGLYGKTPYQKYQEALDDGWVAELPPNMESIMLPQGEVRHARVLGADCEGGVVINKVKYNDIDRRIKRMGLKLKAQGKEPVIRCLYSIANIYAITVCDEVLDEQFAVITEDERIFDGMSKAQFDVKYPSTYQNKGFTGSSVLTNNKTLHEANAKTRQQQRRRSSTKQRRANSEDLANEAQKYLTMPKETISTNPFSNLDIDNIDEAKNV